MCHLGVCAGVKLLLLLLLLPIVCACRDFTSSVVPAILRDKEVTAIDEHGHHITISNPLASFKYPVSAERAQRCQVPS